MASHGAGARPEKMSFARIAAAGTKSTNAQSDASTSNNNHTLTSPPPDGNNTIIPSIGQHSGISHQSPGAKPHKSVQMPGGDGQELGEVSSNGPRVHIQASDATSPPVKGPSGDDGLLAPLEDDRATLVSSSDGDGKPPSLDGKSVASATTFAMDEKESLRPDDSASVQAAAEDEDGLSAVGSGLPGSRIGSDDGVRAFRDQLHEISAMEPGRRVIPQQDVATPGSAAQGVLYVPPQNAGVGVVPGIVRPTNSHSEQSDLTPDPKLLEALDNPRDRIWVLKLEQDVIDFVKDAKESSLNLPQCNSFYRMLAHNIADYYMLGHLVDDSNSAVRLFKTPGCRIPPPLTGVVTPSTAASTPPPTGLQMKILRRGMDPSGTAIVNGSNFASKSASEYGESGNEDDQKSKLPMSREEREARYEAARLRIMGSAKPHSSEGVKENDESRPSSATGRRKTRKQRADSDDGFEARSAYNSYFTPPLSSGGYPTNGYGFPAYSNSQGNPSMAGNGGNTPSNTFQQYGGQYSGQPVSTSPWPNSQYQPPDPSQSWNQGRTQGGYDLSAEFNRNMSLNMHQPSEQSQPLQPQYGAPYYQQPFAEQQQAWNQQGYNMPPAASQPSYGMSAANFPDRPPQPGGQNQHSQPYAFGQLPSQALGRPPNALEHPLPGSYKSPHFNPQSQAFVPGHGNAEPLRPPFGLQQRTSSGFMSSPGFNMPNTLGRHPSGPQSSGYSSPHQSLSSSPANSRMAVTGPLTHPLPQPVFPRQPSPSVSLPAKPMTVPARNGTQGGQNLSPFQHANNANTMQGHSTLAKWGTPASLPAKPPPSATEPFDTTRYAQTQQQQQQQRSQMLGSAAAARMPGGMPSFGSMPSPVTGGMILNGSMATTGKRI